MAFPAAASADDCSVPFDYSSPEAALAVSACTEIHLAEGTYTPAAPLTINRTVMIEGDGRFWTTLGRSGAGNLFQVNSGGALTLSRMTISGVTAGSPVRVEGSGSANVHHVVITGNHSPGSGGGVSQAGTGAVSLTNVTIKGNSADSGGGGVSRTGAGSLLLDRVSFTGNSAGAAGGGVDSAATGSVNFKNVTLADNRADGDGGAVANRAGVSGMVLNNVTVAGNTADADANGTGDAGGLAAGSGATLLRSSVVANNTDRGGQAPDCNGTAELGGYILLKNLTGCATTGDSTGQVPAGTDPKLGDLKDSFTEAGPTLPPLIGSPLINAGNPGAADGSGGRCEAVDQRGTDRPQGDECDIGAHEVAPPSCNLHASGWSAYAGQLQNLTLGCLGPEDQVFEIAEGPEHGTLVELNPVANTAAYLAPAGFTGIDEFTYRMVNDLGETEDTVLVTIDVLPALPAIPPYYLQPFLTPPDLPRHKPKCKRKRPKQRAAMAKKKKKPCGKRKR
jgi:hypothetical protein